MKILIVTVHFAPAWIEGGVTRALWNSARALALAGAQVQVVTTSAYLEAADQVPPTREEAGLSIRTLPVLAALGSSAHRSALAPGLVPTLWKACRDADLCLMQGLWTLPVAVASTVCRRQRVPYVLWAHGGLEEISLAEKSGKKKLYLSLFLSRVIQRSAAVCFTSEAELRNSESALGERPGIVHSHGFDPIEQRRRQPENLRAELGLAADCSILGLSGRIHPRKGFDVILRALANCSERVHLVSFGPDLEGYLREVLALADKLGLGDRFHVLGYLEDEKLWSTYASIDLLVVPSYGESFSNAVIEALAQGTEVMLSDKVALADYVKAKRLGRVVEGHDHRDWSEAIERWSAEAGDFDRERAAKIVATDFDLEESGRKLLSDFDRLLAGTS